MAVRICPECGGKVSDTRQDCPHCGYILERTVNSSECGEKISDKGKEPAQCGSDSAVEYKQAAPSAESRRERDGTDYTQQFLVDMPHYEIKKKKLEKAKAVYCKIRYILWCVWEFLVALVAYLILRNGRSFAAVSVSVMFGTAMLAAVIVLNAWFEYYPSYKYIKACMVWMKSKNYDLYDYINDRYADCLNAGDMTVMDGLLDFTSAYYYLNNGDKFRAYKTHLIIRAAICIAIAAWLVLGFPFVIGRGVMAGFDTPVLLGAIVPTAALIVAYFVTYICLTGRDYKRVRSVYKDI